ncbi:pyridoxal-phosphate dependent enzyme [Rhizobium rhizogenes]|nr:pyridoxal-phosphate dependent enzyme [Rhizobium rhizogenes]
MKFEMDNPGGSHKWRAARRIIDFAVERGDITIGKTTILEKTGGNFGFGLALACAEYGLPIDLVVGPSFSIRKRKLLEQYGAICVGDDMMRDGMRPPDVTDWLLENQSSLGKTYFFTNQHFNIDGTDAHEFETGKEIVEQLREIPGLEQVTFIGCAGTGAHMTGISKALNKAGLLARAIFVDPDGCDSQAGIFVEHPFEGISVMIPPLLDWSLVHDHRTVTTAEMRETQLQFARSNGFLIGNTSAACLKIASDISREKQVNGRHKVFTIAYDHALWYLS